VATKYFGFILVDCSSRLSCWQSVEMETASPQCLHLHEHDFLSLPHLLPAHSRGLAMDKELKKKQGCMKACAPSTPSMQRLASLSTDVSSDDECASEDHPLHRASWSGHFGSEISQSNIQGHLGSEKAQCNNVIIFDWDDTLFPTWYLTEVVQPCLHEKYAKLPEDSRFSDSLAAHAQLMKQVLQAASSVAQVYIVTLAQRQWVEDCCRWFLPGVDMTSLMKELGIRIYYARDYVSFNDRMAASLEDGVHLYTIAKRNAMKKCLRASCRKSGIRRVNVMAVGDSQAEIEAVRDVMWSEYDTDENRCKTVKFVSDPKIDQLASELEVLQSCMTPLLEAEWDADIDVADHPKWSSTVQC